MHRESQPRLEFRLQVATFTVLQAAINLPTKRTG